MWYGWVMGWRGARVLSVCWLGWVAACSSGGGGGGTSSGGGSSSESVGGSSGSGGGKSTDPNLPAVTQACQHVCDHYEQSCGVPCSSDCTIERLVYGEACDVQGLRFYDCAKTSEQDCAEDNLIIAATGCREQMQDYVTCYALEGVTCEREPALDPQCEDKPGTPFSHRCVSDAVQADCVPNLGAYYCCPSQ
jgi:hypothetical protein